MNNADDEDPEFYAAVSSNENVALKLPGGGRHNHHQHAGRSREGRPGSPADLAKSAKWDDVVDSSLFDNSVEVGGEPFLDQSSMESTRQRGFSYMNAVIMTKEAPTSDTDGMGSGRGGVSAYTSTWSGHSSRSPHSSTHNPPGSAPHRQALPPAVQGAIA